MKTRTLKLNFYKFFIHITLSKWFKFKMYSYYPILSDVTGYTLHCGIFRITLFI